MPFVDDDGVEELFLLFLAERLDGGRETCDDGLIVIRLCGGVFRFVAGHSFYLGVAHVLAGLLVETCRDHLAVVKAIFLEIFLKLFCQQVVKAEYRDAFAFGDKAPGLPQHQERFSGPGDPFDLYARIPGDRFHEHILESGRLQARTRFHFPEFRPGRLVEAAQETREAVVVLVAQNFVREGLSSVRFFLGLENFLDLAFERVVAF